MLNTNYNDWLCRLRRVVIAYKLGMISSKNVSAYQLFLTEFGQFNANFTHEEIQRLQYPLSPFANVNRHTYLRATDNWAMQMLRLKYQDDMEGKSKNLYPVFVDSKLFFNELLRYAFVINERDIDEIDENLQNCTVFIQLDNSDLTLLKSKKTNISKKLKDRNLTLLFFIQTTYSEIDAIVFVTSCNFLSQATNSIISNLGYRIDPIKIVRKIFELYPQLFIDEDDTTKVWALLKRIPMNKSNESIDTTEFDSLEKILLETIAIDSLSRIEFKRIINKNKRSYFNTYQIFDRYLLKVSLEPSFRLYADYILNIIVNPHDRYLNIPAIQLIVLPELEQTLTQIIQSLAQKTLPKLIRLTQTISEIKLLMDELSPPDEYEVYTTDNINIGKQLLADYGLQTTLYTSYAMRAFVRVLQIIDAELYNCPEVKPIISVTNQSYFEWLNNLERLKNQQYKIIKVRNLINVDQMSDIIFVELHPNNVVESTQFPHDLKKLLRIMFESWMPKGRTIVIDATLNALNDSEMKSVLTEAKPLIDNGWLNLIIIQSLTKFSQLGLDKRSAGILYILNNGKSYWDNINQRSKQLEHVEIVDRSTRHYFNYFQRTSQTSLSYLSQINKNVRFVYQQTLDQLNKLELLMRKRFTITMSIDPKACYIALNLRDLLSSVDSRFQYNMDDIVNLGENILQYLIHPICQFLGLSLTERMSIGFPLSSINLVMDTMRLTIGLECQQQLNLYADMIAYIAFIINKPTDVSFLFEKIEIEIKGKKKYEYKLQKQFFNEKLKQFKAMTPGKHHSFSLMFKSDNPDYYPPNAKPRKLNRIIKFNNGTMIISREYPMNNSTILCDYDMTDVHVPQRGRGDIPLNECDEKTRRIVASCFSGIIKENGSNRIQFDNSHHSACLTTFESLGPWNDPTIYGPYSIANQPSLNVYIHLHQKEIVVIRNDLEQFKVARHNSIDLFTQDKIDLILGNDVIPIENMLLPEIEFALRENAYNGQPFYATLFAGFERTNRLSPNKNNKMQLRVVHGRLQIQIDYLCSQSKGVTVLKRYINIDQTCITIDYWGIKNSIQARFLRLITAIYVKIQSNSNFIAYDESLNYFLFDLNYEKIDSLFDKALQQIQHHQHRLLNLLFEYTDNEDTYYSFSSGYSHRSGISLLSWPSRTTGTKSVNCKKLIDSAVSILEEAPTTSPNVMKFDVMQTTTLNPDFYSTQQVKKF